MTRMRWVWGLVAVGGMLAACGAPEPATEAPAPAPDGPKPLEPLIFATGPAPVAQPPRPHTVPTPRDLLVLDVSVEGDATRIVYPQARLEPGALYPVLLFQHGYGMDQTQLTDRTDLAARAAAEGWISASPNLGGRSHWANDQALRQLGALVAELVAHHQADPKRIYMVGFSMGGGTALLAAENPLGLPYRVAAVASTQGFTDLEAMTEGEAAGGVYAGSINQAYGGTLEPEEARGHSPLMLAERLAGIPVYLEHGEADVNVRPSHTERLAERLRELGMAPEVHLYPGEGHSEATIHESSIIDFLRGKQAP